MRPTGKGLCQQAEQSILSKIYHYKDDPLRWKLVNVWIRRERTVALTGVEII